MKYIRNRKEAEGNQQMPIHIKKEDEKAWLDAKKNPLHFDYTT